MVQASSDSLGLLLGGAFFVLIGGLGYRSARRASSIPRRVQEAEPSLTQARFNERNMRGTLALAAVGIAILLWGLIEVVIDLVS